MAQKVQFIVTVLHRTAPADLRRTLLGLRSRSTPTSSRSRSSALRDEGATVIFSTHNMSSVEEICDHITLINQFAEHPLGARRRHPPPPRFANLFEVAYRGDEAALRRAVAGRCEILDGAEAEESLYRTLKLHVAGDDEVRAVIAAVNEAVDLRSFRETHPLDERHLHPRRQRTVIDRSTMEKQNGETGQRNPKRLTKAAARTLAWPVSGIRHVRSGPRPENGGEHIPAHPLVHHAVLRHPAAAPHPGRPENSRERESAKNRRHVQHTHHYPARVQRARAQKILYHQHDPDARPDDRPDGRPGPHHGVLARRTEARSPSSTTAALVAPHGSKASDGIRFESDRPARPTRPAGS